MPPNESHPEDGDKAKEGAGSSANQSKVPLKAEDEATKACASKCCFCRLYQEGKILTYTVIAVLLPITAKFNILLRITSAMQIMHIRRKFSY